MRKALFLVSLGGFDLSALPFRADLASQGLPLLRHLCVDFGHLPVQ